MPAGCDDFHRIQVLLWHQSGRPLQAVLGQVVPWPHSMHSLVALAIQPVTLCGCLGDMGAAGLPANGMATANDEMTSIKQLKT